MPGMPVGDLGSSFVPGLRPFVDATESLLQNVFGMNIMKR
jgi:hypothetical protein